MRFEIALFAMVPLLAWAQIEERTTDHKSYSGLHEFIVDNVNGSIDVTATSGSTVA